MKWTSSLTTPKNMRFVIEEQKLTSLKPDKPDQVGYYIYVWENEKGVADYLQDSLEIAMSFTQQKYGVPLSSWTQVAD